MQLNVAIKPRKRPYKKSVQGCSACKLRKVKCDEKRPVCSPCAKRFVGLDRCRYPSTEDVKSPCTKQPRSSRLAPPTSSSIPRPVSPMPYRSGESTHHLELRLMHHYTQITCVYFSRRSSVLLMLNSLWQVDIPQLAFSFDLVMNALLGLTAIDLWARTSDQALIHTSRVYFQKALVKHRASLANVDTADTQLLEVSFIAGFIILHHSWLEEHANTIDESALGDMRTFRQCQGLKAMVESAGPRLQKYRWLWRQETKSTAHCLRYPDFMQSAVEDISMLSKAFKLETISPPKDHAAYTKVIEELMAIYTIISEAAEDGPAPEHQIVTLLQRVPPRFSELFMQKDELAIALLARNISLLALGDPSYWWIQGTGDSKVAVKAVHYFGSLLSSEWSWVMDWPMKIIHGDIKFAI